ncbi:MAG: ribosome-associated translation inhibitor RaiA [Chloroflexi bacterium]|nr:MAG: ribosomal subunit interface protein [Phototrophicales bacterium]RMF82306.1 MAG: ribosome-associated translation inhibitor RaiA [Chloroflexota bacterium]
MNVTIRGQNIGINEELDEYTRKKLDRLDRYLPNISDVRVDLSRQSTKRGEDILIAQITVRHSRGAILRAEERATGDIRTAINHATDNMYRRIQRFKGKRGRKGRERFSATIEELNIAEDIPDFETYEETSDDELDGGHRIVRRKTIEALAMSEDEAIEQMELLGHNFFMFLNGETGKINVLYRRTAGGYGLLIPED